MATILLLDVWLGVIVRYVASIQLAFTKEATRHLMIWTGLLAASCGIARRGHWGVLPIFKRLPVGDLALHDPRADI